MKRYYISMPTTTLLSDFGAASGYPAAMKGVLLEICPSATLVDISHDVTRHDVREGAFLLWMVAPYFPKQTVHCAVVDPGVGTVRRALIISAGGQLFVGPDNGLLLPAAQRVGEIKVYIIQNAKFTHTPVSKTFHGRDIFASVAAHLANGVPPAEIGPPTNEWVKLSFGEGRREGRALAGEVIYIDSFGNIVTNIAGDLVVAYGYTPLLAAGALLRVETERKSSSAHYARGDLSPSELIVTVGSHGQIEIAANRASAAQRLRVRVGETLRINY